MKHLLAFVIAAFSLTAFAADAPAKTEEKPKQEMKLAKKKDHSKDKKVDATKSPKKTENSKK
jgi:Ni/Co efflux regulator RcnB